MWESLVPSAWIWFGFAKEQAERSTGGVRNHFHDLEFSTYALSFLSVSP